MRVANSRMQARADQCIILDVGGGSKLHDRALATFLPEQVKALWDRFEFVYTPKQGSWLKVAEIELKVLIGQYLDRRIGRMEELREEVAAWQARRDQIRAKINWQFTTENARIKLKRLYPTF